MRRHRFKVGDYVKVLEDRLIFNENGFPGVEAYKAAKLGCIGIVQATFVFGEWPVSVVFADGKSCAFAPSELEFLTEIEKTMAVLGGLYA